MAETLAVGQTYLAVSVMLQQQQTAIQRRYFRCTATTGTGATTADAANLLDTTLGPVYIGLINNNASYLGTSVRKVSLPGPFLAAAVSVLNAGVGTAGAIAQAKQTAGLIRFRTDFIGKKQRGRAFVPFPASADDAGNGVPTAGYMTRLNNLASQIILPFVAGAGVNTATLNACLFVPKTGAFSPITFGLGYPAWATQRRRGDFGRTNTPPF